MKINKPLVSIVMPAYNVEKSAGRAIESILNQTFKEFELIIIDDASKDGTWKVLQNYAKKDPRIRLIRNKKNLQIARSLNIGIKLSKANIVARMDADDYSYPDRIRLQFSLLAKNPKVAVVGANMSIVNEKGRIVSKRNYPIDNNSLKSIMFKYSPFAHPVVMYRKSAVLEFGGYDAHKVPCEDIDLWFKIGSKYEFASIAKTLLKYTMRLDQGGKYKLKDLELKGFKIMILNITNGNYCPGVLDVFYNTARFLSLWFMPERLRVLTYDFLRSRKYI